MLTKDLLNYTLIEVIKKYFYLVPDNFDEILIKRIEQLNKLKANPYKTLGDYINADYDVEKKLLQWKGFGQKNYDQLKNLVTDLENGNHDHVIKLVNSEVIKKVSLEKLANKEKRYFNIYIQWRKLIKMKKPIVSLHDYLLYSYHEDNKSKIFRKSALNKAVKNILFDPNFQTILSDESKFKDILMAHSGNYNSQLEIIEKDYPGCFKPLIDEVKSSEDKAKYQYVIKNILETRIGYICFKYYQGNSLEKIGSEENPKLTRERIRQLIKKYEPFMTDVRTKESASKHFLALVKDNQVPRNEDISNLHQMVKANLKSFIKRPNLTSQKSRIALAKYFNLDVDLENLKDTQWNETKLKNEVYKFAKELGKPDFMPMQKEMLEHGKIGLRGAISRFGGQSAVAKMLNLKYQGQLVAEDGSRKYWTDKKIKEFLFDVANKIGKPNFMPSQEACSIYTKHNKALVSAVKNLQQPGKERSWAEAAIYYGLRFDIKHAQTNLDLNYIKTFVKSLGDSINFLSQSEVYVLYQQAGVKGSKRNDKLFEKLLDSLQSGNIPKEELDKWVNDNNSELIDNLLDPSVVSVNDAFKLSESKQKVQKKQHNQQFQNEILSEAIDEKPPAPKIMEALESLGVATKVLTSFSSDTEAVKFFIAKAKGKLWKRCFEDENAAIEEAKKYSPQNEYEKSTRDEFIDEYEKSKQLPIPEGYDFRDDDGNLAYPNLMQKLIAYRILKQDRVLNLSGTGTGKTLSAIVASRIIGARVNVISCPNNTVKGWLSEIHKAFPDSLTFSNHLDIDNINLSKYNYFVMNHEYFQTRNENEVKKFINKYPIDFIVIDEIHRAKQRDENAESQRRRILSGLITDVPEGRQKPRVLGLSATPVINNIFEGRSLIELVTSEDHSDIGTTTNLQNCMSVYQKFVMLGFRKTSDYKTDRLPKIHPIDCSYLLPELLELSARKSHPKDIETILIKAKWKIIKGLIRHKTVIFVDYVTDIVDYLRKNILYLNFSVGIYTGQEKKATDIRYEDSLEQFIKGNTDVLIASIKTVATGVDGLQKVCNNVIFAHLPWTSTEYEQAIGRFDRQGSKFDTLDIHIPKTFASLKCGEEWSYCEAKLNRIQTKKDVANAAVDGEIPDETKQLTPEKANKYWMDWLKRLNDEGIRDLRRAELKVPLDESDEEVNNYRIASYGDFAKMNATWNRSLSSTTHDRLNSNPEEWYYYHTEAKKKEQEWQVVPRNEIINELPHNIPYNGIIADYGCGLAEIEKELGDKYKVFSLDHVAINENVIVTDMAESPLQDNSVDAAVFSLSLMGKNIKDYILDAHRTLKNGGQLVVYHPAKGNNRQKFIKGIEANGFVVIKEGEIYKWHYIWAIKRSIKLNDQFPISFK